MQRKLVNSQLNNFNTYNMYKRQMLSLAENVFEIKNLPEFIDVAFLNKTLLRKGAIAFFKDEVLGLIALPYTNIGALDVYGRPCIIEVYSENGYRRQLKENDFVIMYDNNARYPIYLDIIQMAERIAMNKRVIDINISQQKTPRVWKTSTEMVNTVRDTLNQYDGYVETVFAYDSLDLDNVEGVIAPAPFVADKINDNLDKEWAEFFRLIGVANNKIDKKERLITDEIKTSQGGTIASRYSRYYPRQKAIDEINAKWGYELSVSYYDGIPASENNIINNEVGDINV